MEEKSNHYRSTNCPVQLANFDKGQYDDDSS